MPPKYHHHVSDKQIVLTFLTPT